MAGGVKDKLDPVRDSQPFINAEEVVLHGMCAEAEPGSNLAIRHAFGYHADDLLLSGGEQRHSHNVDNACRLALG